MIFRLNSSNLFSPVCPIFLDENIDYEIGIVNFIILSESKSFNRRAGAEEVVFKLDQNNFLIECDLVKNSYFNNDLAQVLPYSPFNPIYLPFDRRKSIKNIKFTAKNFDNPTSLKDNFQQFLLSFQIRPIAKIKV
jgi:hypothetical protein